MKKMYPLKQVRAREFDERVDALARRRADMADIKLRSRLPALNRAYQAGQDADTVADKWAALDAVLDIVNECIGQFAACKRGCAHCCEIPVPISRMEAERIGAAIGRPPAPAQTAGAGRIQHEFVGQPCPFLKKGACSIYQVRPVTCRVHFNMDSIDMLCAPAADGAPVRVMYWNRINGERWANDILGVAHTCEMADIREFFPANNQFPR